VKCTANSGWLIADSYKPLPSYAFWRHICTMVFRNTIARREGVAHFRRFLPTTARLRGRRSRLCFQQPGRIGRTACFQSRRIESRCAFLLFTW
jgi:hypothetical protein